jgi:hypothetical protein
MRRQQQLTRAACQLQEYGRHPTAKAGILRRGMFMLWTIFAVVLLLWLLGWGFHVAGGLIHLLLVVALVILVIQLITGRRAVV